MEGTSLDKLFDKIVSDFNNKKYDAVVFVTSKILSAETKYFPNITYKMIKERPKQTIEQLHGLFRILVSYEECLESWKGMLCLYFSSALNNLVAKTFLPRNLTNVKISVALSRIAISYFNLGIKILNSSDKTWGMEDLNSFNFDICTIEFNYLIITQADTYIQGRDELERIYSRILKKLNVLLKLDPSNEKYLLLKASLLEYKGDLKGAKDLCAMVVKKPDCLLLENINVIQLRELYKDNRHKACFYAV